ncbi:hypothetical protein [Algoriphagus sp. A40]|uniref:hypothetical protein n=1 Tax=Algoriphagus sp. A40 TaxID=1945863 RepID=UPI000986A9E3|nr:hypothetical protein [Algoriphagus sp. A40]OOG68749.1 hypothetical protein B0E43_21985 [Algoriphagus sp. A40]
MELNQVSTKKIVYCILHMKERARALLQKQNAFNSFLEDLLNLDLDKEFENGHPSLKELSKRLDIKYDRIRKYLQEIYQLLIDSGEELPFSFSGVEYIFYVFGSGDKSAFFSSNSLPVVPRLGESIDLPFLHAYFNSSTFYVNGVSYELTGTIQKVYFDLRAGYFNPYWYFRKAQAEEEGELSFNDLINLNEYQQKAKIGIGRYKNWL